MINPKTDDWDQLVIDKILTYPKEEYLRYPDFSYYYDKIKSLLTECDYILGHTLNSDVPRLIKDCNKYHLDYINFKFYDIVQMYMEYTNTECATSLEHMVEELKLETDLEAHNAMNDAINTMLVYKEMATTLEFNLDDFILLCGDCEYTTYNGDMKQIVKFNTTKFKDCLAGNIHKRKMTEYTRNVIDLFNNKLQNKNVSRKKTYCIPVTLFKTNFLATLNLIYLLNKDNIYTTLDLGICSHYIKYILEDNSMKLPNLSKYNNNGKSIVSLELNDVLAKYDKTLDDISTNYYFNLKKLIKQLEKAINEANYLDQNLKVDEEAKTTFGDLFRKFK